MVRVHYSVPNMAEWSSLVARLAHNQEVKGSNPFSATMYGVIAQVVEQLLCKQKVGGSSPLGSTNLYRCSLKVECQFAGWQ